MMIDFDAIVTDTAASRQIDETALRRTLTVHGWDFGRLTEDPAELDFCRKIVVHHAARLTEIAAKLEARRAARAAASDMAQTAAARAHPGSACTRCGGTGRIYGFRHIESGRCFACGGTGVTSRRAA